VLEKLKHSQTGTIKLRKAFFTVEGSRERNERLREPFQCFKLSWEEPCSSRSGTGAWRGEQHLSSELESSCQMRDLSKVH
jgi:hypothetical protein